MQTWAQETPTQFFLALFLPPTPLIATCTRHNIVQIHDSILWDWQNSIEYSPYFNTNDGMLRWMCLVPQNNVMGLNNVMVGCYKFVSGLPKPTTLVARCGSWKPKTWVVLWESHGLTPTSNSPISVGHNNSLVHTIIFKPHPISSLKYAWATLRGFLGNRCDECSILCYCWCHKEFNFFVKSRSKSLNKD